MLAGVKSDPGAKLRQGERAPKARDITAKELGIGGRIVGQAVE